MADDKTFPSDPTLDGAAASDWRDPRQPLSTDRSDVRQPLSADRSDVRQPLSAGVRDARQSVPTDDPTFSKNNPDVNRPTLEQKDLPRPYNQRDGREVHAAYPNEDKTVTNDQLLKMVRDLQANNDVMSKKLGAQATRTAGQVDFYHCNLCGEHLKAGERCARHPNEAVMGVGAVFNPYDNTVRMGAVNKS